MTGYVHGYSLEEQERLVSQSLFLEPRVYERIDLEGVGRLLEIGCGVGAQLKILARRFPRLTLTGVDRSPAQIGRAAELLAAEVRDGRVTLKQAQGERLPFDDGAFDGAFLCWLLEHVQDPAPVLSEARRVLKPGGLIYATEVYNASLRVVPDSPAIMAWWNHLSAYQESLGGDPMIGPKLGTLFAKAGFHDVDVWPVAFILDGRVRDPARRSGHVTYWRELFLSAAPGLKQAGLVDDGLWTKVEREFARLEADVDALLYITALQARGRA